MPCILDIAIPSTTTTKPWIYHYGRSINTISSALYGSGKWMLFFSKPVLDDQWKLAVNTFNDLEFVEMIKCSTAKPNPRSSDKSKGVIIFYCSMEDTENIMNTGKKILEIFNYDQEYIYFKTGDQTEVGTFATGSRKNFTYKLENPKYVKYIKPICVLYELLNC